MARYPAPSAGYAPHLDNPGGARDNARAAADFSFYRVYLWADDGTEYLLGETDSEGFLDEYMALNKRAAPFMEFLCEAVGVPF